MTKFNFFKQLTTKKLRETLVATFERMPLSVIFAVIAFSIFVIQIAVENLPVYIDNILGKSIITVIVMFFLSITVYLYGETRNVRRLTGWYNQLATLVFGLLFYYFFEENLFDNFYAESFIYIAMTIVGTIAAVFIAPFIAQALKGKAKQRDFCIFGYSLVLSTAMAIVVGIVVMLLGFAGWLSITTLFDIDFDNVYAYWAALSLSLFAPIFFLSQIPSVQIDTSTSIEDNKFFGFLIKYIGLPAITFYFIILYVYTLKVLVNFSQWPHGEVAWMVIGFSFFGYLIYTASYIFERDFKPAQKFRQIFPYIVIPQIFMLFYAIGLRINQYDITINRYLVVAFGIWLLLISLHFIFSHKKYLGAIPLGMILFIIITSLGPWSVYSYPEARQLNNLTQNLLEAGILQGESGTITALEDKSDIGAELSSEIYGSIEYLCNNHGCDALSGIFANELAELRAKDKEEWEKNKKESEAWQEDWYNEQEYTTMNSWSIVDRLTDRLKVQRYYKSDSRDEYKRFRTGRANEDVFVSGYDYFVQLDYEPELMRAIGGENKRVYNAIINVEKESLYIYKNGELAETFSLQSDFAAVLAGDNDALIFELNNNAMQVKVVLNGLSIPIDGILENKSEERDIVIKIERGNASGYVLIREL